MVAMHIKFYISLTVNVIKFDIKAKNPVNSNFVSAAQTSLFVQFIVSLFSPYCRLSSFRSITYLWTMLMYVSR